MRDIVVSVLFVIGSVELCTVSCSTLEEGIMYNPQELFFSERTRRNVRVMLTLLLSVCVVLTTLVLMLVNVPMLRQWVVRVATERINAALEAQFVFDDFRGSLLSDITLTNVRLTTVGDTLLTVRELTLRYDIQMLLVKRIVLRAVRLVEPRIFVWRSLDSSWSIAHVLKPMPPQQVQKPFSWIVTVRECSIQNGSCRIVDSLQMQQDAIHTAGYQRLNLARIFIDTLNLGVSIQYNPKQRATALSMYQCSLREETTGIEVRKLSCFVHADAGRIEIPHMTLQTAESCMRLRMRIDHWNIMHSLTVSEPDSMRKHIEQAYVECTLRSDSLSIAEVRRCTPAVDMLGGKLSIRCDVYGSAQKLVAKRLEIQGCAEEEGKPSPTLLSLEGEIQNVLHHNALAYTATIYPSRISSADVRRYFPGMQVPYLHNLGVVTIERGKVNGTAYAIQGLLHVASTAAGKIQTEYSVSWRDTLRYTAQVATQALNLAA
ncbi:MAG: hypothetical protein RML40_12215, partial [Bacteroidota bacterium]|nr:hypothetical protein [Candidatus Kapabacteria bacterium]MDW8221280.1 hypothetical protein [Bacteroidota bacterium]